MVALPRSTGPNRVILKWEIYTKTKRFRGLIIEHSKRIYASILTPILSFFSFLVTGGGGASLSFGWWEAKRDQV